MNALILVFLFSTGQVQYTAFGNETIAVQTLADTEENTPAFEKQVRELSEKSNVKVCAVVPSYEFTSPLHNPLYDLMTEKEETMPGIWEEQQGIRNVFKLKSDAPITIEIAAKYCKLAAPVAFK